MEAARETYETKSFLRYAAECTRMARLARGVKQASAKKTDHRPRDEGEEIRKPRSEPLH